MTTGVEAMTQNNIKAAVLGICLAATASLAQAQVPSASRGVYFGGALGQSEAKEYDCTAQAQCENRGTIGRAFIGLQFGRHWSFEMAYTDLGTVKSETPPTFNESVKVRLGEAVILPSYPLTERFMVYGRAGGYYAQTTNDFTLNGVETRLKETNGGLTWGFGLQYYVTNSIALRGEMQRYMKIGGGNIGDSDYNAVTVGALWKMR
jgi:opacity protein-like surface antigen